MPSCVVKSCKNNSMEVRKDTGVTFHKFPKDVNWKHKWIEVVRECRNQDQWLPSKFSVVCSAHFKAGDIYVTQGGNRRVTKNAVPELKLFDKVARRKKIEKVENVSVSVQTNYMGAGDDVSDSEMTTSEPRAPARDQIENVIIKLEPTEPREGADELETQVGGQVENVVIKVEPEEPAAAQPAVGSTDPLAPPREPKRNANFIMATIMYEDHVKRKNVHLEISKKKIKILQEKLNRLQKRNLKLKNILQEIKRRKLIDKDTFKQLTAGLARVY